MTRDSNRGRDRYSDTWGRREDSRYREHHYNSRSRNNSRMGSRYRNTRGDYGPILARELDSSYDEKVNRNFANSIFVGNLTYDCTPDDLKKYFSGIGEVVRADIITSRGHHRGMGTVEFTNTRDVDEAIRQYDGSFFMDRSIFVRQDNPPPEDKRDRFQNKRMSRRSRRRDSQESFTVHVDNLPYSINWQALKDMFKECGEVLHADVEIDSSGYSKGRGVVVFPSEAIMKRAIRMYNNYEIDGKTLVVTPSSYDSKDYQENFGLEQAATIDMGEDLDDVDIEVANKFTEGYEAGGDRNNFIFCSNLPESTAKSDLFDLFGTIGNVANAELRYDESGAPTGIAVIEYSDIADADVCIERLHGYKYGGCDLNVSYAKKI